LANKRIRRTKSLAGYLAGVHSDLNALTLRDNIRGIAASSIDGTNFAEEIELFDKSIQSGNYVPNTDGWKIDGSGSAEFANVFIRGDINAETGTIGYWNISSPAVRRTFGSTELLGTFLESADLGTSDSEVDSGAYVSMFKSYVPDPVAIDSIEVSSNSVIVTSPGHGFVVGDKITVFYGPDNAGDPVYDEYQSITYVEVVSATDDTFTYFKPVGDNGDASNDLASVAVSGTAELFNEDVAGLYLRDYGRVEFDYGYFSNKGVKYVAADRINLFHNPSFEYRSVEAGIKVGTRVERFMTYPDPESEYPDPNIWGVRITSVSHGFVEDQLVIIGTADDPQILFGTNTIDGEYLIEAVSEDGNSFDIILDFDPEVGSGYAVTTPFPLYGSPENAASLAGWTYLGDSARSANVSSKVLGSDVATLETTTAHGYLVGEYVTVSDLDAPFDGTWQISGATLARTVANATIVISTGVLTTAVAHGLTVGQQVYLTTTGALPTGLTANTRYYVRTAPTGTTLTLASIRGGSAITLSGTQSGTHTLFATNSFSFSVTNTNVVNTTDAGSADIQYANVLPMSLENARSDFGLRSSTYLTATSDYISGSVDYKAAVDYKIIEANRPLYFGFDMYYNMVPTAVGAAVSAVAVTRIADKTVTNKARTSNVATITTSAAHGFTAGLQVGVWSVDDTFDGTYLILATPTTTTFTYASVGDNVAPTAETGTTYSTYTTVTTGATAHGLAVGDLVYLDFDAYDTGGARVSDWRLSIYDDNLAALHAYQPNTYGKEYAKVFQVLGVPTTTTFRIVNPINEAATGAITVDASTNVDGTARTKTVYRQQLALYDLDNIRVQFGSDATTKLSEILTDTYSSTWSTSRYLQQYDYTSWMNTYLDPDLETKIPMVSTGGLIQLSAEKIQALYIEKDPDGYAAEDLFKINFPLWMYRVEPTGVVTGTKAIATTGSIGFALDSVYISTSAEYFYGDMDDTSTDWYDSGYELEVPAQASLSLSKTWIDIDLESQTGVFDYLNYVGFKPSETTRYYFSSPSVSSKPLVDYMRGNATQSTDNGLWVYAGDLSEKSSLTFTSGAYQNYDDSGSSLYEGVLKSYSGIDFSGVEISAHRLQSDLAGFVDPSLSTRATIDLYIDQADRSMVEIDSDMVMITGKAATENITAATKNTGFQIGYTETANMAINKNELQARNNGAAASLYINNGGGSVVIGVVDTDLDTPSLGVISGASKYVWANGVYENTLGAAWRSVYVSATGTYDQLGYVASSSRYKKNIEPLRYTAEQILSVRAVEYHYNSDEDSAPKHAGMIAEEMHDAGLHAYVSYDRDGLPQTINYEFYVSALQQVVRSQAEQISDLYARLTVLENK
jgi:hypothetical protein